MWNNLKASIASVIRTNNNQEITGANLQSILNTIVNSVGANATFAGIATPSTNPGTPDGPVFYIAYEPGVYSNFNITTVDGLYILENKTGSWVGTRISAAGGTSGTTFTPHVDSDGNLSWTNDGGKPNPETVNIKGPQGDTVILGDGETYKLYNSTGQNTDGAMTQKAVTDKIAEIAEGQGTLTFDDTPTAGSNNPVKSNGIKVALDAKQDTLTFDNAPTADSNNPVKSNGVKVALDAKQDIIDTVNIEVDSNVGTPSGSASFNEGTLLLSFQNLKGTPGIQGQQGERGPQGERGLPGPSGVTGDVSGFTVQQTIDPYGDYGATDIAGAASLQATNAELTEVEEGLTEAVRTQLEINKLSSATTRYTDRKVLAVSSSYYCAYLLIDSSHKRFIIKSTDRINYVNIQGIFLFDDVPAVGDTGDSRLDYVVFTNSGDSIEKAITVQPSMVGKYLVISSHDSCNLEVYNEEQVNRIDTLEDKVDNLEEEVDDLSAYVKGVTIFNLGEDVNSYSGSYSAKGLGIFSRTLADAQIINKVTVRKLAASAICTAQYKLCKLYTGNSSDTRRLPNTSVPNMTIIKEGTLELLTTYKDFDIEIQDTTINVGEQVIFLVTGLPDAATVKFAGWSGNSSLDDGISNTVYLNTGSTVEAIWSSNFSSGAIGSYGAPSLILSYRGKVVIDEEFNAFREEVNQSINNISSSNVRKNFYASDDEYSAQYKDGLADIYIDQTKFSPSILTLRGYNGYMYLMYKQNASDAALTTLLVKDFSQINNNEYVNIEYNSELIGYLVFNNKQKFIDYPTGSPLKAILDNGMVYGDFFHKYQKQEISDGSIGRAKLSPEIKKELYIFKDNITPDYSDDVLELYLPKIDATTKTGLWHINDGIYLGYTVEGNNIFARTTSATENGVVYPLAVYYGGTDAYPNGSILGYIVFKDVANFKTKDAHNNIGNINEEYCNNIKNAPAVAKYINYYQGSNAEFIPEIRLPNKIYAVVGDTLQIFYRAMFDAWNIDGFKIACDCSVGKSYPRYFEYTPTSDNIGSTTLSIVVYNQMGVSIATASTTLVTVPAGTSPSSNVNVVIFGDSLTAGGAWPKEMNRRLTAVDGTPLGDGKTNITFCGSMNNGGTRYFGVGGWSWKDYVTQGRAGFRFYVSGVSSLSIGAVYTNNGHSYTITEVNVTNGSGNIRCDTSDFANIPQTTGVLTKSSGNGDNSITFSSYVEDSQNPLWDDDNNEFTFVPYANQYCNSSIDVVYTLLSWNGFPSARINEISESSFDTIKGYVHTFADKLHTEFPNAKLKLIGLQCPSLDGGFAANYGASLSLMDFKYMKFAFNLNKMLQTVANEENYSSFVEFVDGGIQVDPVFGEQYTEKPVNTRSNITEKVGTNGVHPSSIGLNMYADAVYRNFIANFCQ